MLTLLALLACSGSESDVKTTPLPAPEVVAPPVVAPVAAPAGETRTFDLAATGGAGGAPDGAAFIVPPGTQAELVVGPLSDGSTGMKLTAKAEGDALMCLASVPLGATATFGARLKVSDVKPGAQTWQGMNVELRARDANGGLVSPAGSRYVLLRNDRTPGDWSDFEVPVAVPAGATSGEFCFRFVNATGTVEVDKAVVKGIPGSSTAAASGAGDAAKGPVTRFDLDAPGGGSGAPAGFDFLVPPGTTGTTLAAGPVDGGAGFTFAVAAKANTLACSQPFPVSGTMRAATRVRVTDITTDSRAWTGFTAEIRSYDAAGALVSPEGSQFLTLGVLRSKGAWQELGKPFAALPNAATAKLCLRFVESTGAAEVDWAEIGPG